MRSLRNLLRAAAGLALVLSLGGPAHAVAIDWVTVGDPGNAPAGDYGAVGYTYKIGKYEVTNAQYAEFLNAVAATDTYGLYNTEMGSGSYWGGITRSGSSGSYTYSAISDRQDMPVNWVSFWDSLRFANWLHNGQPTGAQGNATTEDGAYTLDGYTGDDGSRINRNADARVFLTSEDEWYKAAYYNASSSSYFVYPASSDAQTTCAVPGATPNTANCYNVVRDLTGVGSYTGSASPYGTFDQGGNLWEWNEAIIGSDRGLRGGAFAYGSPGDLEAFSRAHDGPADGSFGYGFRVAMIPEPGTGLLVMAGVLGLAVWRRGRTG